jgi:uracil permease
MKKNSILWGNDKPGRAVTLGLQHVFAMFGSTVLVPALTGLDPAVTLLCMGIGTLIFHLITGGMVPAFMGSSFSFIVPITAVAAHCAEKGIDSFASYVGIGIMASGILYLVLAGMVKFFGAKRITNFFPPIVTGCMIIIIGMMLAPTAMSNITTITDIPVWKNWVVAIFTVITILVVMFFTKGFIKLVPILIGIVAGYALSLALGMVDTTAVTEAAIFELPKVSLPRFKDWGAVTYADFKISHFRYTPFMISMVERPKNSLSMTEPRNISPATQYRTFFSSRRHLSM